VSSDYISQAAVTSVLDSMSYGGDFSYYTVPGVAGGTYTTAAAYEAHAPGFADYQAYDSAGTAGYSGNTGGSLGQSLATGATQALQGAAGLPANAIAGAQGLLNSALTGASATPWAMFFLIGGLVVLAVALSKR
jgi:hypothetical protein